ncbi:MAG: CRISPR system precrRNA processing endoribonuclease RAMP protein Cas6 [Chloroflexaceae bacterium]|nr:CRISPR system precrRNA processing endoribonuclease RAMP protein Cas6 [Chloroflexaceae bacterium]
MGASLRGAFFSTLWSRFCCNKAAQTCAECPLVAACPVSMLVAPLRHESPRGRDVPRPFALRPHSYGTEVLQPGESFVFGLTLFGWSLEWFPYVAMTLEAMGEGGIGLRVARNGGKRGQFTVEAIQGINLFTGEAQLILQGTHTWIQTPGGPTTMTMTWADAEAWARTLPTGTLSLHFLTPLRLVDHQQLVKRPHLRPLVARLLERHDALSQGYGGTPFDQEHREMLLAVADGMCLVDDETHWVDLQSFSRRQKKPTPIGGLVGRATYVGEVQPLLPLLAWGMVLQVGKDATKGNGVYTVGD